MRMVQLGAVKMEDTEEVTGECVKHGHLDEEKDGDFLEAIIDNKPEKVQDILSTCSKSRKAALLSSHYEYNDKHVCCHLQGRCFRLKLPLALAMAVGAHKVMSILLKAGADPCETDCQGNNVLHTMAVQIFYHPDMEQGILASMDHFIRLVPEHQMRNILHHENEFKLRPLEFAAQHGCCHLMLKILDIPGHYLAKQERHGLTIYQWYDVTDYEATGDRYTKSPIILLTFSDSKTVHSKGFQHLNRFMKKWFTAKFKANIPAILLLLLFRLIYICCYFVVDMNTSFYGDYVHGNTTQHCRPGFSPVLSPVTRNILRGVLLVSCICVMLVDGIELILNKTKAYWPIHCTVEGGKSWQVQVVYYKCCNMVFSIFVLVYVILGMYTCECYLLFYDITRVTCPILAVWNILYFVQLLPSIGSFVIAITAILEDMRNFSIVFIIFMIPFMHSFQTVINTNTNVGCIESFDSMFRIVYSLFITMLNMIDYTTYDVRNPEILFTAHIAYTFVVSIMMINFFIALMSGSVSSTIEHKSEFLCLQRASVALTVERRCQWIFKPLYKKIKRSCFHYENGRYYIVQVKSVLQNDCQNCK